MANDTAKIEAVNIGRSVKMILTIVIKKMIKRCHASSLKPSGTRRNQSINATSTRVDERKSFERRKSILFQ
jgi:hypothetical protein